MICLACNRTMSQTLLKYSCNFCNNTFFVRVGANGERPAFNQADHGIVETYMQVAEEKFQKLCKEKQRIEAYNPISTKYYQQYVKDVIQQSISMCHNEEKKLRLREEVRSLGLEYMRRLVEQFVTENFIWEKMSMILREILSIIHEEFPAPLLPLGWGRNLCFIRHLEIIESDWQDVAVNANNIGTFYFFKSRSV